MKLVSLRALISAFIWMCCWHFPVYLCRSFQQLHSVTCYSRSILRFPNVKFLTPLILIFFSFSSLIFITCLTLPQPPNAASCMNKIPNGKINWIVGECRYIIPADGTTAIRETRYMSCLVERKSVVLRLSHVRTHTHTYTVNHTHKRIRFPVLQSVQYWMLVRLFKGKLLLRRRMSSEAS
jgi:hypothetical protein